MITCPATSATKSRGKVSTPGSRPPDTGRSRAHRTGASFIGPSAFVTAALLTPSARANAARVG